MFVLVIVELGVVLGFSFEEYCWLVLVWIGFEECLQKGNVGFSKEMLSKIYQNPCSCFGYRLI